MWGDIAIAFLLAFITSFMITPFSIKLAKKWGAIDLPNDRRVNKKPIPRIRRNCSNNRFSSSFSLFNSVNAFRAQIFIK